MSVTTAPPFQPAFLAPRYWLIWLALGLLIPLAYLPWRLQWWLGHALGNLAWRLAGRRRRRRDTLINLAICFPQLPAVQREQWGRDVFVQAMLGLMETLSAWYAPKRYTRKVTIDGLHHLLEARQRGNVLLLGAHYTLLDAGGYLATRFFPASIVYRPQNNPLLEWLITRARAPIFTHQIDHDDMRTLLRLLKQPVTAISQLTAPAVSASVSPSMHTPTPGPAPDCSVLPAPAEPAIAASSDRVASDTLGQVIWYTPDQDFGLRQGVMAPFFGHPAATLTAHRRLARLPQVQVMAIQFARVDDRRPHYHIHLTPVLTDFPGSSETADAERTNRLLEQLISKAPTQYMWFHRRFKTQPDNLPNPYQQSALPRSQP